MRSGHMDGGQRHAFLQNMWTMAREGKVPLFDNVGVGVQIFHLAVQEHLAGLHLWNLLERHQYDLGWITDILSNKNKNDFGLGVARSFGYISGTKSTSLTSSVFSQVRAQLLPLLVRACQWDDVEASVGLISSLEVTDRCTILADLFHVVMWHRP